MNSVMNKSLLTAVGTVTLIGTFAACAVDPHDEALGVASYAQMTDAEIAASCGQSNPKKVAICHIPPGHPENARTLCISENAVATHNQHHGDYLGPCQPSDDGAGGGSTDDGGGGTPDDGGGDPDEPNGPGGLDGGDLTADHDTCSEEYPACPADGVCELPSTCLLGCCVPFTN